MEIQYTKNAGGGYRYRYRVIKQIVTVSGKDISLKHCLLLCFREVLAK